jgi:uncharacterized protein (DUF58 family)
MLDFLHHSGVQQLSRLEVFARQVVEGFITGLHKSPFHGFSVEFAEHRLYNSGESTRHIDWKLYGRSDKLFVKRYEEETNLRCQLVMDHSSSMYFPFDESKPNAAQANKINFSIYAAAALSELFRRQRDAVGLTTFSSGVEAHIPARSAPVHFKLLYNEMEKMMELHRPEKKRTTLAAETLHQVAEVIHQRSLVIIFSDMFDSGADNDALFSALQHLRHKKHEVILFHVTEKQTELDFDFENRPHRFIDMETGEELKMNPSDIKADYLNSIGKFTSELKLKCSQFGVDFVEADISQGYFQILYAYLLKRQSML